MIKKLAICSSILLTGCSMFGSHDDSVALPDNSNTTSQQETSSPTSQAASSSAQQITAQTAEKTNVSSPAPSANTVTKNSEATTTSNSTPVTTPEANTTSTGSINLPQPAVNTSSKSPINVMNNSILVIQSLLEQNASEISNNPKELKVIIDKYLLPNIDTNRIAAMMLGPKWRTATPEQKTEFINQFLTLLTGLYAKNVAKVGQYQLTFNNLPESAWKGQKYVQVSGVIKNQNENSQGSSITIYIINQDGKWLIYDIAVEGISIMQNYQSQFRPISTMQEAIEGVKRVNARSQG